MRLTKIYTKIGDKGTTLLASGERISKSAPRIDAYGTVDELNAFVGCLVDELKTHQELFLDILSALHLIQNELFDVGAELSLPNWQDQGIKLHVVKSEDIERLEHSMDAFNVTLPPLENFVLPGGTPGNSWAHIARTVCRRAERRVVLLSETEDVRPEVLRYLNRLSDWFFVLSRAVSQRLSIKEITWNQQR